MTAVSTVALSIVYRRRSLTLIFAFIFVDDALSKKIVFGLGQ